MRVAEGCIINTRNKSHQVTANVDVPKSGADGVIVTQGGIAGGWTLYAHEGKLKYCNFLGIDHFIVSAARRSPRASIRCGWNSTTTGAGWPGRGHHAYIDGKKVGSGRAERTPADGLLGR